MATYRLHGLTIRLPIAMAGLTPAPDDATPDVDVRWTDVPPDVALRGYLIRRGAGRDVAPITTGSGR